MRTKSATRAIALAGSLWVTLNIAGCGDEATADDDDVPTMDGGSTTDSGGPAPSDSGSTGSDSGTQQTGNCCTARSETGCSVSAIEECVCGQTSADGDFCCDTQWDDGCVDLVANCEGYETACAGGGTTDPSMTFFVTSRAVSNDGANLGGLSGADAFCNTLADEALGNSSLTWCAYLSTSTINARDRIGAGPWRNAAGDVIADDVNDLHSSPPPRESLLDETGERPPFETHDVLTGSDANGNSFAGNLESYFDFLTESGDNYDYDSGATYDTTCNDWTSGASSSTTLAIVGHSDWDDPQQPDAMAMSWNSAHVSYCNPGAAGPPPTGMVGVLGDSRIYCFARSSGSCPQ